MGFITCKFGGTSLADASCFQKVKKIILSNPERRYIVPSAPGKRTPEDKKITDLLYAWHTLVEQGLDASQVQTLIADRFLGISRDLGLKTDVKSILAEIESQCDKHREPDFLASRGEYINGILLAEFLGATFVDPADYVRFDDEGALDPATYEKLGERLRGDGLFVIPGFYGAMPDGRIRTFSRGGSDVSGSIVARATGSRLYENWTDVSGFRMADPRLVPEARRIEEITYQELRELSYMGANVLHDEAIFPVREPGIPINIKNTNEPDNPGTLIVATRTAREPVCGIAGRTGFAMVNIEKALMNKERGFGRRVLAIFEENGISFEHLPTSIDTMSVIVREEELGPHGSVIVKQIERACSPDRVTIVNDLALIATVGQGMAGRVGVAATLFTALANAGVNVRVIDQGSSENNIIVGVASKDLKAAVQAIYRAFAS